ncbi:hypothetical protein V5O48_000755 [Marasmius crinis-equi]|uniref:Autophagy-related protein 27 n=1 Tax=Marasmius crinis-equi TaxID=585013 RepID=A0ABR3G0D1_9AGAR
MSLKKISYLLTSPLLLFALPSDRSFSSCKFSIEGNSYDLCPIVQHGPFTVGKYLFNGSGTKERYSCSGDTWICMNDSRRAIPVALSQPPTLPIIHRQDSGLQIHFPGASLQGISHSVLIDFVCDLNPSFEPVAAPTFLAEEGGIHSFRWATKHACPTATNIHDRLPGFSAQTDDDSDAPPDQNEDGENLVDPTEKPQLSARETALTISIVGVCLLTTCYFIYNPPTYLIDHYLRPNLSRLHLPHLPNIGNLPIPRMNLNFNPMTLPKKFRSRPRCSRPHNFRVGENRLVQWAQEDLSFEDDVDTMVNAYDDENAVLDEYVPLSQGMGWQTRRAKDYGTTKFP